MNEMERIREKANEIKLSLEAASSVKTVERPPRSIPEMLSDWRGKTLEISPELKAILNPWKNEGECNG